MYWREKEAGREMKIGYIDAYASLILPGAKIKAMTQSIASTIICKLKIKTRT
jgi:hypothetical protein